MTEPNRNNTETKYTLATRDVDLSALIVTGIIMCLLVVWACLTKDKLFLFIPICLSAAVFLAFVLLLTDYLTLPKIAIQADIIGIYFNYRNNKQIFIRYDEIIEVRNSGIRNKYGRITIATKTDEYKSIKTKQLGDVLLNRIDRLLNADDKEKILNENSV